MDGMGWSSKILGLLRWGWYTRAGRRKMNKMNIRINRRKVYILLYIYGRLRCYAGAARRKPYVVPSSTKWPHFTHLTQMTSSECKQFLKIIFHAFQHLHLTLDGWSLGYMLYQNRPLLDVSKQRQHNFGAAKGQLGVCQGIRGVANAVAYDQQRC